MISRKQIIADLAEYSSLNFDRENILQESEYLGESYQSLAQDVADHIAFAWNRMSRDDNRFNDYQDRLENLVNWVKESK